MEIVSGTTSTQEALLNIAHGPVFPFFALKLIKAEKRKSSILEIEVPPEIYDLFESKMGTHQLLFYLDHRTGKSEVWSADMLLALDILQHYQILSSTTTWLKNSVNFIALNLNDDALEKKVKPDKIRSSLNHSIQILTYAGLLEKIDEKTELFSITRDVINSNKKDPDSAIYRLAMMLYHSARLAGKPALDELEDPGSIYLKLMDSHDFSIKYDYAFNKLSKLQHGTRSGIIKTFISFICGAYLYYYVCNKSNEE